MTDTTHDTGSHTDAVEHPAHSSAAERLGGPTEAERASADRGADDHSGTNGQRRDHGNATLIAEDKAEGYRGRWNELKGEFVDEPRRAVRGANELVGEVLDELEQLFRRQRDELERGLDSDDTSTEDLRQALGNYRSFFDRLLSF
ncbi:MAG TPA: hypothetical protein VIQ30_03510 [Pseudonocardia sp.]|jgi:hypothetical protein